MLKFPLIDLHCDVLYALKDPRDFINGRKEGHCDLPRMIKGEVSAQVFSLFVSPRGKNTAEFRSEIDRQLELLYHIVEIGEGKIAIVKGVSELGENFENGIISVIIEIEGLHPLGDNLAMIEDYFHRGVRMFTLTWNNTNAFANAGWEVSRGQTDRGLTGLGRDAVREIGRLGGIIDLSHASDNTFQQVMEFSPYPPLVSHSCMRHFKSSSRNISDTMLHDLAQKRGVLGLNFYPGFLSSQKWSRISIKDMVVQMDYIKGNSGIGVLAFGSDFDGVSRLPQGVKDISYFPAILKAMDDYGFSEKEIALVAGGNFIRFWKGIQEGEGS
ncbi:membrane dipeptidase [bacterium]|nr:membrane dipeptidase [bacterium]